MIASCRMGVCCVPAFPAVALPLCIFHLSISRQVRSGSWERKSHQAWILADTSFEQRKILSEREFWLDTLPTPDFPGGRISGSGPAMVVATCWTSRCRAAAALTEASRKASSAAASTLTPVCGLFAIVQSTKGCAHDACQRPSCAMRCWLPGPGPCTHAACQLPQAPAPLPHICRSHISQV